MIKQNLAEQLRDRACAIIEDDDVIREIYSKQIEKGVPLDYLKNEHIRTITESSDQDMIDSYITCSNCGEKAVQKDELENLIRIANNADDFIKLVFQYHNHTT